MKKAEGKHYLTALTAVERKLVHVIYAVWKRGTPFVLRQEPFKQDDAPKSVVSFVEEQIVGR